MDKSLSSLPPLDWLRTFEAAARHESFTEAAEELGLTQAAVSQQMRKLETQLKVTLFHRLPRGVELTAEGDAYLPSVRASLNALLRSTEDLFGVTRTRAVTIAAPTSLASLWLSPRLRALAEAKPQLHLSVAAIHRPADYEAIRADIEIRFGDGVWPERIASHLFSEVLSPVCAPGLLAEAPQGQWRRLPALSLAGQRSGWSEWALAAGVSPPRRTGLRFDSFITALDAARAGAGVLLASLPLAAAALQAGEVVRLSPVELAMPEGYWLVRSAEGRQRGDVEEVCRLLGQGI